MSNLSCFCLPYLFPHAPTHTVCYLYHPFVVISCPFVPKSNILWKKEIIKTFFRACCLLMWVETLWGNSIFKTVCVSGETCFLLTCVFFVCFFFVHLCCTEGLKLKRDLQCFSNIRSNSHATVHPGSAWVIPFVRLLINTKSKSTNEMTVTLSNLNGSIRIKTNGLVTHIDKNNSPTESRHPNETNLSSFYHSFSHHHNTPKKHSDKSPYCTALL